MITSGKHDPRARGAGARPGRRAGRRGKLRDGALAFARKGSREGGRCTRSATATTRSRPPRQARALRGRSARPMRASFRGFRRAGSQHPMRRGGGDAALRRRPGAASASCSSSCVRGTQSPAQRYYFFAERQAQKVPDVPEDTADAPMKQVGIIGAGTMGGGIAMNFANVGMPGHHRRDDSRRRWTAASRVIRRNYERSAQARPHARCDDVEQRMGLLHGLARPWTTLPTATSSSRRCSRTWRSRRRSSASSTRICQAGRDPGHQHLLPGHQRDRRVDRAAGRRDRPALLLAGQRDAAAGGRARREDRARRVVAPRMQLAQADRQDRRRSSASAPASSATACWRSASARPTSWSCEGAHALGRRPGALRLRLPDGPFRHARPRRPRHRLVARAVERRRPCATSCASRPPRPEDRRRLLRLRREPQRHARRRSPRKSIHDFAARAASTPARSPTRRSSSAAFIR